MSHILTSEAIVDRPSREIIQKADGAVDFCISPELQCRYDPASAVLWTNVAPQGIPCFSAALLRDMERGSQIIEGYFSGFESERRLKHIVVRSDIPNVFNLGGDLAYFQRLIAAQDRARLTEYARAAINVGYRNYVAHNLTGVTTIALLEGDALGGGFESALSCDIVIAEKHVRAGFPEVLFDMFPGMGGLSFLSRRVNRNIVNDLTRTGRQYTAQELQELGVIDLVVDSGEGMSAAIGVMRQRERQHGAHSAMNAVDKLLHPITLSELNDVVRLWVDCALRLSPRGLEWMRRLHKQQTTAFGGGLTVVPNTSRVAA